MMRCSLGADPLARNSKGKSGHDMALENGHAEVAVLLRLGRGEDLPVGEAGGNGEDAGAGDIAAAKGGGMGNA